MLTKQEIREEIKKVREGLSTEYIEKNSKIIQEKLFLMEEYIKAECIFAYMSVKRRSGYKKHYIKSI